MLKKLLMLFVAFALVVAPGGFVDINEVDAAKKYSSGKKSVAPTSNDSYNKSSTTKPDSNSTSTPAKSPSVAKPSTGGFMKGMLFGGIAGLLLGSMFSELGILGAILGLFINVITVLAIVMIIRKLYTYFKYQKHKKEYQAWKR